MYKIINKNSFSQNYLASGFIYKITKQINMARFPWKTKMNLENMR